MGVRLGRGTVAVRVAIARPRRPEPNGVRAKDFQSFTYCFYVGCTTFIVGVGERDALTSKQAQLITMQSKGWLSAILCFGMNKINDLWEESMHQRKVRSPVHCCGQDGYLAQVPQHPINSYTHLTSIC